jgi:hypothetical protein
MAIAIIMAITPTAMYSSKSDVVAMPDMRAQKATSKYIQTDVGQATLSASQPNPSTKEACNCIYRTFKPCSMWMPITM